MNKKEKSKKKNEERRKKEEKLEDDEEQKESRHVNFNASKTKPLSFNQLIFFPSVSMPDANLQECVS